MYYLLSVTNLFYTNLNTSLKLKNLPPPHTLPQEHANAEFEGKIKVKTCKQIFSLLYLLYFYQQYPGVTGAGRIPGSSPWLVKG